MNLHSSPKILIGIVGCLVFNAIISPTVHAAENEESPQHAQLSTTASQSGRSNITSQSEIAEHLVTDDNTSAEKTKFLNQMALMNRLYNIDDIAEYRVPGLSGDTIIISPAGYTPVFVGTEVNPPGTNGKQRYHGIGTKFNKKINSINSVFATGLGFSAGYTISNNLNIVSSDCNTIYFTPEYSSNFNHRLSTCYEKWQQTNSNNYIYNRWAWFKRATPVASQRYSAVLDFTIRSKPWKGYENRIARMTGHTPAVSQNSCSTTATVSLGYGAATLNIPIHRCSYTEALEEFNEHSGGIDWNGQTTKQLYLDFGMKIESNGSSPIFADYAWVEICDSLTSWTCPFNPSQYLIHKDAGWKR